MGRRRSRSCVTELGLAAAPLLLASAQYTDLPHLLRRRQRMDLAAEMQWALLPPLVLRRCRDDHRRLLEPAYEVGGDCFDYAYNAGILDFAVFDMVGHGLRSAVLTSLLVGAYRHGRRSETTSPIWPGHRRGRPHLSGSTRFATAILARLDVARGRSTG